MLLSFYENVESGQPLKALVCTRVRAESMDWQPFFIITQPREPKTKVFLQKAGPESTKKINVLPFSKAWVRNNSRPLWKSLARHAGGREGWLAGSLVWLTWLAWLAGWLAKGQELVST